ncbi:MAG: hypothetical protein LC723_05060 [Actinobacteria bacterium]|nr:hypothetical protein [Actinomycetota bacterium]
MAPFDTLPTTNSLAAIDSPTEQALGTGQELAPPDIYSDDANLLEIFNRVKRECMEYRWVWEREWQRDLFYINNRQWITYHTTRREWVDKRLHKWMPRPVTNKMGEVLTAIRTTFAAIDLAAKVRPSGNSTQAVSTAEVADEMEPLIREEHRMVDVISEADFWLIATGSVVLHLSWDKDKRFNRSFVQSETCTTCGATYDPATIKAAGDTCPDCGSNAFIPATLPDGKPNGSWVALGRGKTVALSPFEWAFPSTVTRFDEVPYLIRLRWRDKSYYEANYPTLVPSITWETSPIDRSLQIFKSLALSNDVGTGSTYHTMATAGPPTTEGITEYELWMKPTEAYPKGLVMRVIGDRSPVVLRTEDEALPGPIPYEDVESRIVWPFAYARYEQIGGRLYGRSAITPLIQKQDQLNQVDSLIQLIVQRMANPIWLMPEGAGVEQFSGEPGFVMKWNPLAVGGTNAKPERIAGVDVPSSLQMYREQLLKDIEDLAGTYDIIKGQKPTGVEAFSALQLLVERSQSRFTSVFKARGEMYREWYKVALELERQFGPDERVLAVTGPNKSYAFKYFEKADLQGAVTVLVEDGSDMPKTSLGRRAAIEQASQLQLINPADPDQRYKLLTELGLAELDPSLDIHVQAALQMQDAFEEWMETVDPALAQQLDPLTGMPAVPPGSPLQWKPWHNAQIHWSERVKWLNTDKMREALAANPVLEAAVMQNLAQLQMALMPGIVPGAGADQAATGGGGMALGNSNANSTSTAIVPSGQSQGNQGQGPA